MDSQGPEAGKSYALIFGVFYLVIDGLAYPDPLPATPKPPAGPDDDCDGDPNL